jgi:predicted dehydrogenase
MIPRSALSRPPVVAVVGTGFIAPVHIEALRRLGVRVRGVLGSSPEKSRAGALRLGLETGYANYAALLADPEVSAVHLTSPNRYHRAQVLAALAAGKHVVCEKPLAMTPAESAELVAAAATHPHLVCAVNYNVRFYPLALHARALVRRGEIGEVLHLHGSYLQDWLLYPTEFQQQKKPGGSFAEKTMTQDCEKARAHARRAGEFHDCGVGVKVFFKNEGESTALSINF